MVSVLAVIKTRAAGPCQRTAARCRSARSIHSRLRAWVAASTTGGATPARWAWGPSTRAQAPAVARVAAPGTRSPGGGVVEVVAGPRAELEELRGDHRADRVHTGVLATGVAAAIPVEARHRVGAAALELTAQHVARHDPDRATPARPPLLPMRI